MFQALFYSISNGVCQFEIKISPTASSKKFYKRTSLVVSYWYKIIIMCRIRMINFFKCFERHQKLRRCSTVKIPITITSPQGPSFDNSHVLYNSNGHLSKVAISLQWPALYTSLYNGYYSTKGNCLYNGHLSTTATSLQWLLRSTV